MRPMLIFDAHLDLSYNALDWNRDLRVPVATLRERERGDGRPGRANGTVALPEMRRGGVGLCVATLLAPCSRPENPIPGWHSPEQSWAQVQGQLAWYRAMEEAGEMEQVSDAGALRRARQRWENAEPLPEGGHRPVSYVLSLEGADPLVTPGHLEILHAAGLRALGPAHYGPGRYACGTDSSGPLDRRGKDLLREMDRLGIILDATHLCDDAFWDALDVFEGPVWASHSNCRALVPHNRQFSDEQLRALVERGAVIGAVCDTWMLVPGWVKGVTTPAEAGVVLRHVVDHIDHLCQLAGSASHCGIGSDLDGGFGREQSPSDLDTIADLQKIAGLLEDRGFTSGDVAGIMHGNFLRFLDEAWSDDDGRTG